MAHQGLPTPLDRMSEIVTTLPMRGLMVIWAEDSCATNDTISVSAYDMNCNLVFVVQIEEHTVLFYHKNIAPKSEHLVQRVHSQILPLKAPELHLLLCAGKETHCRDLGSH